MAPYPKTSARTALRYTINSFDQAAAAREPWQPASSALTVEIRRLDAADCSKDQVTFQRGPRMTNRHAAPLRLRPAAS